MCPPLHEPSASGATLDLPRASLCPPKNPEEHPKIHRLCYRGCDRILPVPPVFSPPPKNGCNRRIPSSQTPKLFGSRSSAHPGWLRGDKGPIHPVLKHHWYLEKPEWILRSQSPTAYSLGSTSATWGGNPPPVRLQNKAPLYLQEMLPLENWQEPKDSVPGAMGGNKPHIPKPGPVGMYEQAPPPQNLPQIWGGLIPP